MHDGNRGVGMATYGYMRISTEDQRDDLQRDALVRAGVSEANIYTDTMSGSSRARTRPAFDRLSARLRSGDELVIWKFDRLGRSVLDLVTTIYGLHERGMVVRSLTEGVDTSTPLGRALVGVLGAFAEVERENIRERVKAGMAAAKARGRHCGRFPKTHAETAEKIRACRRAGMTAQEIARDLKISRTTLYSTLKKYPETPSRPGLDGQVKSPGISCSKHLE